MAANYDLNLTQGSKATFNFTVTDADGAAVDFTGLSIRGSVKHRFSDSTALVSFTPTFSSNVVTMTLTSTQTAALPVGVGVYDIEKYTDAYDADRVLGGNVFISPEVTTT